MALFGLGVPHLEFTDMNHAHPASTDAVLCRCWVRAGSREGVKRVRKRNAPEFSHILAGYSAVSGAGGAVLPATGKKAYGYYRCNQATKAACSNVRPINSNALDAAVWKKLKELFQDGEFGMMLESEMQRRATEAVENYDEKIGPLTRELEEVDMRTRRPVTAIEDGKGSTAVSNRLRQLEDRRISLRESIKTIKRECSEAAGGIKDIELLPVLKKTIAESGDTPQSALLQALIGQMRLDTDTVEIDLSLSRFALTDSLARLLGRF